MKTIKTIALLLVIYLAQYPFNVTAQTCIEYLETGITIRANAIDRIDNVIRYDIQAPIDKLDLAQDLLNIKMLCDNGLCTYSNIVSVPNLNELYQTFKGEQSDVGVYVYLMEQKFASNIIIFYGLLKLDNNWSVKQK